MATALRDDVAARWREAMFAGDWEAAWRQTDRIEQPRRRLKAQGWPLPRMEHHLRWDGTPFKDKRVLVRCEHGLGDTIQFMRFVPEIARVAREVIFLVQPMLLELLAGAPGLGTVLNAWTDAPPPEHDVEIEVMELAYALRCTAQNVPAPYPHLAARVRGQLPVELPQDDRLRVGLVWAASEWDDSRSIPLSALQPLLDLPQVRVYGLQQGAPIQQALARGLNIVPLWQHTERITAAAAALLEMDVVLSIDGMVAHLGGTLGRPTWVLLKHEADWRWMQGRSDTPWYPTARIFRQPRPGDWEGLVSELVGALENLPRSLDGGGSCHAGLDPASTVARPLL